MKLTIPLLCCLAMLVLSPEAFAMGDKPLNEDHASKSNCIVGGCSGQLCTEAGQGPAMSTCEFKESYLCYGKYSQCERQSDKQCGWTPSQALTECLGSAQ